MPDEPNPLPEREPSVMRATLEKIGAERVKLLMAGGMLVHHLCVPAMEWLTEIEGKKDAAPKG